MFEKVSADVLAKLEGIFGEKRVSIGARIGADYAHDELPGGIAHMPEVVVEAMSTEEVAALLKLCGEERIPVTVRGAGTGQAGGSVPVEGGIVLSVKGMDKILEFDEQAHSLTVQPGVLLQDVKAEAESHGLYYPPDPGEKTATIGGNVATNAAGPCALKYGCTKDYVLDAVVVLADGTVTKLSSRKEYDAIIGSEGTLAVITEITLKLIDRPSADVILLFPFLDTESCIKAAVTIIKTGFEPSIAEYMDTDIVEFAGSITGNPVFPVELDGERVGATLMVTLEAEDDDAVMEKMESIAELAEELECLDILVGDTPTMKRDFWDAHDAFHTSMESGAKCANEINVTVPTQNIAEFVEFAKDLGEKKALKVMAYAHVGSGGVHIHAVSDCEKDEFAAAFAEFAGAVYDKTAELGGDIGGEYGVGYAKKSYLKATLSEETFAKFSETKTTFDPAGILNPGKVI